MSHADYAENAEAMRGSLYIMENTQSAHTPLALPVRTAKHKRQRVRLCVFPYEESVITLHSSAQVCGVCVRKSVNPARL